MPRSKSTLPGGVRTSDMVTLGVLAEHVPALDIAWAITTAGRQSKRERQLPAELVVLYVVALSLFRDVAYEEVLSCVWEGARWLGFDVRNLATKGAISQARTRLGKDVLRLLFERLAVPLAGERTQGARYRDWLTVAIDGSTLSMPDSKENAETFGYAAESQYASYPFLRCVCLCETGTHALLGAAMGPYRMSEQELVRQVLERMQAGMLVLADRNFLGVELWKECLATGADLLWRASATWSLKKIQTLSDGSWLANLSVSKSPDGAPSPTVRVIRYTTQGSDEHIRLVTSILDPQKASALELASVYTQRWEIESVFDEMKTHLKGARMLLRSKVPELVEQEFWGLMIAHRAIRALMHEAALAHNKDPDKVSFVSTIRIVKRTLQGRVAFSPQS